MSMRTTSQGKAMCTASDGVVAGWHRVGTTAATGSASSEASRRRRIYELALVAAFLRVMPVTMYRTDQQQDRSCGPG